MTDAATLLALAGRVEKLTGPDREIGNEVLLACGWQIEEWGDGPDRPRGWINPGQGPDCEDYLDGDQPDPTASLDAAMTLARTNRDVMVMLYAAHHSFDHEELDEAPNLFPRIKAMLVWNLRTRVASMSAGER